MLVGCAAPETLPGRPKTCAFYELPMAYMGGQQVGSPYIVVSWSPRADHTRFDASRGGIGVDGNPAGGMATSGACVHMRASNALACEFLANELGFGRDLFGRWG
jgi:hypothetical protein